MLDLLIIFSNITLLLVAFILLVIQFFRLKPERYENLANKKFPRISGYILLFSLFSMLILILISVFIKGGSFVMT